MNGLKYIAALGAILTLAFITSACSDSTGPDCCIPPPPEYSHQTQPGIAANDFLADSNFSSLTVEVDYMDGYAPNQRALDSLKLFLEQRLNKTSVSILEPTSIEPGEQQAYTAEEIRELEKEHRDEFTTGQNLAAYMIIVDGSYEQGNVLGIAYYNTSVAFFGETVDTYSGGATQPPQWKLEGTVMRHEFGHLFGLVNIDGSGTEMQIPHQDEENGHHCDNDQCLMHWAVQTTDFIANLVGEDIPALDQNCILDLQANGGR